VFTARYAMTPYITQIYFVFKGLMVLNVVTKRGHADVRKDRTIFRVILSFPYRMGDHFHARDH